MEHKRSVQNLFSAQVWERIQSANILVVGAGGIGCELLKNLVLTGFKNITVIDLDTVDVSNLNRQFLFRKHHVGKSKALMAKETIDCFKEANIVALHDNIKNPTLSLEFFKKFTLVMNALDNQDARRFVNRMCITADLPLLESGTQGLNGQVQSIIHGKSACYECEPKATPKQFPVCTIRSTPDRPIHCITWSKYLYDLLFGPQDEGNLLADLKANFQVQTDQEQSYVIFAQTIFEKVFNKDIEDQKKLSDDQRTRNPISLEQALQIQENSISETNSSIDVNLETMKTHSVAYYAKYFIDTVVSILTLNKSKIGWLTFDKDDKLAVQFVTSASNIRSHNFNIPLQSEFKVKEMAGNIVPAVASTNAIIAGIQVTEAIKILSQQQILQNLDVQNLKSAWASQDVRGSKLILSGKLPPANQDCYACSGKISKLILETNIQVLRIRELVEDVAKTRLSFITPSITAEGKIIFEDGEDLDIEEKEIYQQKFPQTLEQANLKNGTIIEIDELDKNFQVYLTVQHNETIEQSFEIHGQIQNQTKSIEVQQHKEIFEEEKIEVVDEVVEVAQTNNIGEKRKADQVSSNFLQKKKKKATGDEEDPIVL